MNVQYHLVLILFFYKQVLPLTLLILSDALICFIRSNSSGELILVFTNICDIANNTWVNGNDIEQPNLKSVGQYATVLKLKRGNATKRSYCGKWAVIGILNPKPIDFHLDNGFWNVF